MAIGDSLNPDCTVRACRVPLLFMSILAQRLHPVVIASVDCMSSIPAFMSITGEHVTNQNGHLARLNETGIASDEHVTSLVSHWSSMKSDNDRDNPSRSK